MRGREAEFYARDLMAVYRYKSVGGVIGAFDMGSGDKHEDWLVHRLLPEVEGCMSVKEVVLTGTKEKQWCVRSNFRDKLETWSEILNDLGETGLVVKSGELREREDGDTFLFCEAPEGRWERFDKTRSSFGVGQLRGLATFMGSLTKELGKVNRYLYCRNEGDEFFVNLETEGLRAMGFDLSRSKLVERRDVVGSRSIEGRNMEWMLKNFYWALIKGELGQIDERGLTESWDQLACDYNDADPTKVMDKLLTHLSMGALAGVKAKLLRKLEEGGGNAQKRYADLGLIFSETRFVIKDLLKGAAPDSDWVESTTDLAKRLASVLG